MLSMHARCKTKYLFGEGILEAYHMNFDYTYTFISNVVKTSLMLLTITMFTCNQIVLTTRDIVHIQGYFMSIPS